MLEPFYGVDVAATLDKIESDPGRRPLWNAICDAIDLVCEHPDSAQARREAVRIVGTDATLWQVRIRRVEDDDWVMLWFPDGLDASIEYIGPRLFR